MLIKRAVMTDAELRGVMLKRFYDVRREGLTQIPNDEIFDQNTAFDICRQLAEHGLINWKPLQALSGFRTAMAQITAQGVDIVEGTNKHPPISIVIDQSISVHNSPNAQVARDQGQNVITKMRDVSLAVDANKNATEEEKAKAKSLWSQISENSLLRTVLEKVL
jgi:maltodextrin utilization protein YvdJ